MEKQISVTETASEYTGKISFGSVSKECLSLHWFPRRLTNAQRIIRRSTIINFAQIGQAISTVRTQIHWRSLVPSALFPSLCLSVKPLHIRPVQRSVTSNTTQWQSAADNLGQLNSAYRRLQIAEVVDNTTKSTAKTTMSTVWYVYSTLRLQYVSTLSRQHFVGLQYATFTECRLRCLSTVCVFNTSRLRHVMSTVCYVYIMLCLRYVSTEFHVYATCLQNVMSTACVYGKSCLQYVSTECHVYGSVYRMSCPQHCLQNAMPTVCVYRMPCLQYVSTECHVNGSVYRMSCLQNVMYTVCVYRMSCLQHCLQNVVSTVCFYRTSCLQNVMSTVCVHRMSRLECLSTECHVYNTCLQNTMSTECHVYSMCLQNSISLACLENVMSTVCVYKMPHLQYVSTECHIYNMCLQKVMSTVCFYRMSRLQYVPTECRVHSMCLQNVMSTVCVYRMPRLQYVYRMPYLHYMSRERHIYSMCLQKVMSTVCVYRMSRLEYVSTERHIYSMSTECHVYSMCLQSAMSTVYNSEPTNKNSSWRFNSALLCCDVLSLGQKFPNVRRFLVPPSSGQTVQQ